MAKPIMVQGTMSGAGKSLLAAALCRIFTEDGYRVAPFKSQNMALNSFVTADGLEMGRAQVVQAAACKKAPDVRMNPVLLKPSTDTGSQVIVNGEVLRHMKAADYYKFKKQLIPAVLEAYESLAAENDIIVIEGAGSPAEINLRKDDFVNMGLAEMLDAPVLLAGDIDRGGVFAQLYGTVELLEPSERERVKGFLINKFRGDVSLLESGLQQLEDLCGIKTLGVIPYLRFALDEEDSLAESLTVGAHDKALDVAVIRFPKISNFTDFAPLEQHPVLGLRYVSNARDLGTPDLIVLPGTKSTVADLLWMRQNGLEAAVLKLADRGTPVLGICGGYQMLGGQLFDPDCVELDETVPMEQRAVRGLGLLPAETTFQPQKTRTQTEMTGFGPFPDVHLSGYEIHNGTTVMVSDELPDHVFGTYLHGLFDTGELTEALAGWLCDRRGLSYDALLADSATATPFSHDERQEAELTKLAAAVREAVDMEEIYRILEI